MISSLTVSDLVSVSGGVRSSWVWIWTLCSTSTPSSLKSCCKLISLLCIFHQRSYFKCLCFFLSQRHPAWRGQVRAHRRRPLGHGESRQGAEEHCAGLRAQSGNTRCEQGGEGGSNAEWERFYMGIMEMIPLTYLTADSQIVTWMTHHFDCIVFADYITSEHRSMMETAYVYGSKYQFILITGGPVLKHLGYVSFTFTLLFSQTFNVCHTKSFHWLCLSLPQCEWIVSLVSGVVPPL